jgi:hypothetical protein
MRRSSTHVTGEITAVGSTVLVGGGYDAQRKLKAVVDVFTFG